MSRKAAMKLRRGVTITVSVLILGFAPGVPTAAATARTTPFTASSSNDPTLRIDGAGREVFVEPAPNRAAVRAATAMASRAVNTSFAPPLHSRPGAPITLYIDVNGGSLAGTRWDPAVPTTEVTGIDIDGDPKTFNASELELIVLIWAHVAEDYAPFDVDITTEEPLPAALRRDSLADRRYGATALIIDEIEFVRWCGCGGLAYLGGLGILGDTNSGQPALVFTADGAWNDPKILGESVAHELGHQAGLGHDGVGLSQYAIGADGWAPIMGLGYGQPLTQWSRGEYPGATDSTDDYATMRSYGIREIADDHGDTRRHATRVHARSWRATGIIASPTDRDQFRFSTRGGTLRLAVGPASYAPNLDLRVTVRRSDGAIVARIDPPMRFVSPTQASGLGARTVVTIPPGRYWITIDGTGGGAGDTAYTDYGSVGRYSINTRITPAGGS
jgi:hypothetical protein